MSSTQTNTWPPLISGSSADALGQQQLYGQEVLASAVIQAQLNDLFYNPTTLGGLTGFSSDGIKYASGVAVPGANKASWFTEPPGPFRGTRRDFPLRALLLVTDAGLSILDLENSFTLWMMSVRANGYALTDNFRAAIDGATPSAVCYQSGRIMVTFSPDPGSDLNFPFVVTFDLAQDQIYLDRAYIEDLETNPVPTAGGSLTPVVLP